MRSRVAGFAAALAAIAVSPSASAALPAAGGDSGIRITDVAASPTQPQAGGELVILARIEFVGTLGAIHCSAQLAGRKVGTVRLTWENSIARCSLLVPRNSQGRLLKVMLRAKAGGNLARQSLGFRVA